MVCASGNRACTITNALAEAKEGLPPAQSAGEHSAVGEIDNDAVELLVQLDIGGEAVDRHSACEYDLIEAGEAVLEVFEMRLRHAALGGEPGGQTFERAANLDRRMNVALVEGVDD